MASTYISSQNQEEAVKTFLNFMIRAKSNHINFNGIMREIDDYFEADRVVIFEIGSTGMFFANTFEFCKIGVKSQKNIMQNLPIQRIYSWMTRFYEKGAFYLKNDEEGRKKEPSMHEPFEGYDVKDIMVAPFSVDGDILGFIGIDNPKTHKDQLLLLTVMANSLYKEVQGIKEKDQLTEALKKAEELNRIYEEGKIKNSVIELLAKSFFCIYHIDLETDSFTEVSTELKDVKGFFKTEGNAQKYFDKTCEVFISNDSKEEMKKFTNLSTLSKRMYRKESLGLFFSINNNDWCEGTFICAKRNEEGDCTQVIWVVRSVTDQIRLEKKLEDTKQEFSETEEIFASAGLGTWTLSCEEGSIWKMTGNRKFLEIIGADETMTSKEIYDYWYPRVSESGKNQIGNSVGEMFGGKTVENTYLWNHPDRGDVYVRSGGTVYELTEGGFVIRGYYGEVTDSVLKEEQYKKDLETALMQAQTANMAKSGFLARMSHDIRTPLNGIIGLIEIGELHEDDVELMKANRVKAKIAANHLLELINDVLDMSKLEDGSVELAHEAFNIHQLSLDILTITGLRAQEKNLTIENLTASDDMPWPCVYGSPLHVRQIFMNIMSNAVKYNRDGGKIIVCVTSEIMDEEHVKYIVSIRDTGIGMSSEFMEHLFEPFSQERIDARSVYEGTGLGMSIVKALVDKMGGTIEVESEPDEGTVFTVTQVYEIAPDEEANSNTATSVVGSIEGVKILMAEDNELNTEIAVTILEDAGAVITTVENGKAAVDEFKSKPIGTYDVILMDIMMPEMNGYEATMAIRKLPRMDANSIPIIAMTANAFAEDVKKAHEAGMTDHMSKPLNINKLTTTIMKYVDEARKIELKNMYNPFFDKYYGRIPK